MSKTIKTKQCSKCKQIKTFSEFHKNSSKHDGLCSHCKSCRNKHHKQYRDTHWEQRRRYNKLYYRTHRPQRRKLQQQYRQTLKGYSVFLWQAMLQRCNNPKNQAYKYYGGRGIQVKFSCFEDFYNYVTKELKVDPRGLTIDRIDGDGHYEPRNIQFITRSQNTAKMIRSKKKNSNQI